MRTRTRRVDDFGRGSVFGAEPPASAPDEGSDAPLRLLFVCTANISRSPYAEMRARQILAAVPAPATGGQPAWTVASAGIPGLSDRPMDPQMRQRAMERGVPAECCDTHRSRPLNAELVEETDLILTMEKRHRNAVLDTYPSALGRVLMLGQAAQAAQQILENSRSSQVSAVGLVRRLVRSAPRATGRLDVPDPYRRGDEISRRVARLIDEDLVTITSVVRDVCTPLATVATERGGAT